MSERIVLLHSPLLGGLTWRGVADVLRARGLAAEVVEWPKLTSLEGDFYRGLATAMAASLGEGPATVVVHSDRGSQFRSRAFLSVLGAAGLTGSMGRVASAGDNAAMESFFSLLQKNVLDQRTWATRSELRYAIVTWIEHTYNHRRRQRGLGRLTPVEFELAFAPDDTTAAHAA